MEELRKLTFEEHNQLALLLEMTRLYNMQAQQKFYSTKKDKEKSRERKIEKLIDELKNLLDDQVVQQYNKSEHDKGQKLIEVYYSRSKEAQEKLKVL